MSASPSFTLTPERQAIVEKYRVDLLSGRVFALAAQGYGSGIGYRPPISRREWSPSMQAVARMAAVSDPLAQIATAVIGRVNLYGDAGQACSAIYRAATEAVAKGYTDVIRRASPEPGRPSDQHRAFTLREIVEADYWLIDACKPFAGGVGTTIGAGWCLSAIAREIGYVHPEWRR